MIMIVNYLLFFTSPRDEVYSFGVFGQDIDIDSIRFAVFHQYLGIVCEAFGLTTMSDTPASCRSRLKSK